MSAALEFSFTTWLIFGIVSVAAGRLGVLFPKVGLPLITGYLFVGALCGPYVLSLVKLEDVPRLGYVTQFALAFIAFSAGAELYLPELRSLFKRILYMTTLITVVTFILVTLTIYALTAPGLNALPYLEGLEPGCRLSVATIFASIMVARSPASAIAVVKETKSKGVFTSTLLGVTVLADVYVLLGFTLTTTVAETECSRDDQNFSGMALVVMIATIVASIVIGLVLGRVLVGLMWFKRFPARYLILPLGLAVFVACHQLTFYSQSNLPLVVNLEPLLICITAGYVCTNTSRHRQRFISVLQQAGPYVFLPFFTLTGASLNLEVMSKSIGVALVIAALRAVCIFIGSATGGRLAGAPQNHSDNIWMTLLTQAGVSLGLASEIGMSFPGWGRSVQSTIIAIVLINQLTGPILFKIAVKRVGDAGKGGGDAEFDEDAAVPAAIVVGDSPAALTTAARLLRSQWSVTLVVPNEASAAAAREAIVTYTKASAAAKKARKGELGEIAAELSGALAAIMGTRAAGTEHAAAGPAPTVVGVSEVPHDAHEGHHGPKAPELYERFTAVVAIGSGDVLSDPLGASDLLASATALRAHIAPKVSANMNANGKLEEAKNLDDPLASRWSGIVALLSSTPALSSVFVCLTQTPSSDAAAFSLCDTLSSVIARAPRRSHLNSVRLVSHVRTPEWAAALVEIGVTPMQGLGAAAALASAVIRAPRSQPLSLLSASSTVSNDEIARSVFGLTVEGAALAALGGVARPGEGPPPSIQLLQMLAKKYQAAAETLQPEVVGVAAGLVADVEAVPDWRRDEYITALSGLSDNSAIEQKRSVTSQDKVRCS
jgi:Kef-type K+ transport system membrane component KefB